MEDMKKEVAGKSRAEEMKITEHILFMLWK